MADALIPLRVADAYAYYIMYADPSALADDEIEMVDNYVQELSENGDDMTPQMQFKGIATDSHEVTFGRCDICKKMSDIRHLVAVYAHVQPEIQP